MNRAADLLVRTLVSHCVDRVFCVPGESYLAVLDGLADQTDIDVVACRHEGGAGFMAVADAKLTNRPGVAFFSRGPGATNAAIALHTAEQDAVPLVLFVGQVERKDLGRGAFQELDYEAVFGTIAKRVWQVTDGEDLGDVTAEAFHLAQSGTPGPVLVVLPEDMLFDAVSAAAPHPLPIERVTPKADDIAAVADALAAAERPLIIAGTPFRTPEGRSHLARMAEAWNVPVATSFKNQDIFDNDHALFAGHLGYGVPAVIRETLEKSDLILALGTRLGDVTTQGYLLPKAPTPDQTVIHVYADAAQVGRVIEVERGVVCDPVLFAEALALRNAPDLLPGLVNGRHAWGADCHGMYDRLADLKPRKSNDGLDFGVVIQAFNERLAEDAIITQDAGNFGTWMHRHIRMKPGQTFVGAASGAMGLGMPSAVAAGLRFPGRQVLTCCGDGGIMMTGNELATAVQYGAKVRVFVSNNGSYGTIRLHQEKAFPGRLSATDLGNPDFAAWATSFGALGLKLDRAEDALDILDRALAHDGPVVVDVDTSLENISAFTTLDEIATK